MWWQVLPPIGLVTGFVSLPFALMPAIQYVFTGRPTMRGLVEGMHFESQTRQGFRRDFFMCGNEYESRGLENIPDD